MARTVSDCALLLEVLAGSDDIDGRQAQYSRQGYSDDLTKGVKGLRIGVVQEGFQRPESEPGLDDVVLSAIDKLGNAGATVESVSIPWHNYGSAIWLPIGIEGPYFNLMHGHGVGYGANELYLLSYMRALSGWQVHAKELPPTIKAFLLAGNVMSDHGGRLYAKAQNLRHRLRAEYDAALASYDVLVMPTTPMTAPAIPAPDASITEVLQRSWEMLGNTCPFNLTGHPAISVRCGHLSERPVGLMVVGRHYQEKLLFQVAEAIHTN